MDGGKLVFLHHDELLDESPFHPFLDNMISHAKHDRGSSKTLSCEERVIKKNINLKLGDGDYGIGFNSLNIFCVFVLPMAIVIATSTLGSWRADSNDLPKNGGLLSHGGTPSSHPFF